MALTGSQVEKAVFGAEFSSGDSNKLISQKLKPCQEENNNEVDELSEELQMGCIVDAVKRPPNICIETCVFDSDSDVSNEHQNEEDAYTDEFEEDNSDGEDSLKSIPKSHRSGERTHRSEERTHRSEERKHRRKSVKSAIKLSKSHSFLSTKQNGSVVSSRTSNYGSISVPQTRRINMSFSNDRLREIERHNHILLNKILSARNNRKSSIPPVEPVKQKLMTPSAAVRRKKQQKQIDRDNMVLLRKIQSTKSSVSSIRR